MDDNEQFAAEKRIWASKMSGDTALSDLARSTLALADKYNYPYQWTWLGVPIIQLSNDIMAQQEIVWKTKPDLIIETGVARGGSVIFLASLLELIGDGRVIGIDVDIRDHNRKRIESHPLSHRIELIEGSSVAGDIVAEIAKQAAKSKRVMVILDSNHTHEHVLAELRAYAPMVSVEQYLIVADTVIEYQPPNENRDRPWGEGNSPMSALNEYRKESDCFELDQYMEDKLLYTATPGGYLKCVK